MFGIGRNKDVNVSLNHSMDVHAAHGTIWVRNIERPEPSQSANVWDQAQAAGAYLPVNFRADRPQLLKTPSHATLKSIYEQMKSLGMEILHIEVKVTGETKIYGL